MAARTRFAVAGAILGSLFSTRDAVLRLTFASRATSTRVGLSFACWIIQISFLAKSLANRGMGITNIPLRITQFDRQRCHRKHKQKSENRQCGESSQIGVATFLRDT